MPIEDDPLIGASLENSDQSTLKQDQFSEKERMRLESHNMSQFGKYDDTPKGSPLGLLIGLILLPFAIIFIYYAMAKIGICFPPPIDFCLPVEDAVDGFIVSIFGDYSLERF
jgi:hypothetical protein